MKALILAAGKGTRIGHLTNHCPRPMLSVGDKPLLAHLVQWLRSHGIIEIAVNLHHAPAVITDYFGDGSKYGVTITYSYEAQLLGTASTAKRLEAFLDEPFVVVDGDLFTNINLTRLAHFHATRAQMMGELSLVTLALSHAPNPTECGFVELDQRQRVVRFVEKPPLQHMLTDLTNVGIFICEPAILQLIPEGSVFDFSCDLLPRLLLEELPLYGQTIGTEEFLIGIGTPAGFEWAQTRAQQIARSEVA
ncbi:MAG: nucleotidyltransferase family protein [Chloroflexota bacterium]|nr:nucleotidyltransferase family protein [Chloroflexota bacterium]